MADKAARVLVVGATGELGRLAVHEFLGRGVRLALAGRDRGGLADLAATTGCPSADMTSTDTEELGPVDYLVVEFPPATSHFTGEMATARSGRRSARRRGTNRRHVADSDGHLRPGRLTARMAATPLPTVAGLQIVAIQRQSALWTCAL
ncbi:hypothetical protein ACFV9E_19085 [Streptomyces sp. NPDC059835]|uniref:hypothetical protein n=1 Tax=Streptomyces sp. NPDC059835 TaxID=3346967 RepID=UPI00364845F2